MPNAVHDTTIDLDVYAETDKMAKHQITRIKNKIRKLLEAETIKLKKKHVTVEYNIHPRS